MKRPFSSEDVASSSALPLLFLSWSLPVDLSDQVIKYLKRGDHKHDRDEEEKENKRKLTGDGVRLAHQSILAASRVTIAWCIHHMSLKNKAL